jgi:hypothetical protein
MPSPSAESRVSPSASCRRRGWNDSSGAVSDRCTRHLNLWPASTRRLGVLGTSIPAEMPTHCAAGRGTRLAVAHGLPLKTGGSAADRQDELGHAERADIRRRLTTRHVMHSRMLRGAAFHSRVSNRRTSAAQGDDSRRLSVSPGLSPSHGVARSAAPRPDRRGWPQEAART